MTRHVNSCRVYVETSRIRDRILTRQAARGIRVDGRGRLEAPDVDDDHRTGEVSVEDVRKAVYREVATSEGKRNCLDFVNDVGEWLADREALGSAKGRQGIEEAGNPVGTLSERKVSVTTSNATEISPRRMRSAVLTPS
jgi:hypothetical protein